MKIAFIPDCHIKKRSESSDFYFSDDEMFNFLYKLSSECDEIYITGDFIEMWQAELPIKRYNINEYYNTYFEYMKTINYVISNPKINLVVGNHDEFLPEIDIINKKCRYFYVLCNSNNDKIYITHGIEDLFNKNINLRKITRFGSWVVGVIERLVYSNWELWVNKILTSIFHIELVGTNKNQIKAFKKLIDLDDSHKVYIAGHTHKPQILRFFYKGKERLFINGGYFDGVENYYGILDTETLEVDPYKIIDTDFKKFKISLEKGDILLSYKKGNIISAGIANVTDSEYSHALMYIGNGRIIESISDGIKLGYIDKYLSGDYNICKVTLKDRSQVDDVIKILFSRIGMKYGYLQNLLTFILILLSKISGKDMRKYVEFNETNYNCSELIADSIKKVYGYGYNSANFFPSDFLAHTDYFNYEKKIVINY